jgi:hypothetical protein
MSSVGVIAQFEFVDGSEDAIERFFRNGRAIVETSQPATTVWFAYRVGPSTYGAFASFANDEDRQALLSAGGPRSSRDNVGLFVRPPTFEQVDIVAVRQPGA